MAMNPKNTKIKRGTSSGLDDLSLKITTKIHYKRRILTIYVE